MTTRQEAPNVPRAWRVLDSMLARTPPRDSAFARLNGRLLVAGVLARAGLADSARHVAQRSRGDAQMDPTRDLALTAAYVYILIGDRPAAMDQLKVYLAANPARRQGFADDPGWQFRTPAGRPRLPPTGRLGPLAPARRTPAGLLQSAADAGILDYPNRHSKSLLPTQLRRPTYPTQGAPR